MKTSLNQGVALITVLVFGSVFLILVTILVSTVIKQHKVVIIKTIEREALAIAEAGLDYYGWYLSHNPGDFTNGTGNPGPHIFEYNDAGGDRVGEFEIEVASNSSCGLLDRAELQSTGRSDKDPSLTRTVVAQYRRPSVSNYAFIVNNNSWIPSGTTIKGRYHANGGIHMEGSADSIISSTQTSWTCTKITGCNPTTTDAEGVFGSGGNSHLWQYPVSYLDFPGLSVDLVELKTATQNYNQLSTPTYYPPADNGKKGYKVEFEDDGTVSMYKVQSSRSYYSYNSIEGWVERREATANGNHFLGRYDLPEDCKVVFFEDDIWISGNIKNKLTIVAADLEDPNRDANIYILGDINYSSDSAADGVTFIAEGSILVPLEVPDVLNLKGVFVAQRGLFGRNYYTTKNSPGYGGLKKYKVPGGKEEYVVRSELNVVGTVVSNGTPNFRWNDNMGINESGFSASNFTYDSNQLLDPPPLTPSLSQDFRLINWRDND